jgi:hypothetical protein
MYKPAKTVLVGSALLFAGIPLAANEAGANAGVAAPARAYINCPGITSVPMTSDAEQALPLAQIATLSCGEAVAVLSDNEGYTTHIRTAEGQEGYVARMYLTNAASPFRVKADEQPQKPVNATPQNGVVRWVSGAPGCDQFQSHGRLVESATTEGITVQVSLQDSGWKLRATVAVFNQSGEEVFVLPALVTLDELTPSLRNLRQENPAKLAHSQANHMLLRDEANAMPTPSAIDFHSGLSASPSSVSYRNSTPDYTASSIDGGGVQSVSLKTKNLAPGEKAAGALWFTRDPNAHELSMRLSVGNLVFDFPFSFEQKK